MNKPLRTLILIVLALVVVGAVSYVLFAKKVFSPTEPLLPGAGTASQRYTNSEYDFRFGYPEGYVLTERSEEDRYTITLVHTEDAVPPEGGEGPTAITIDVYQRDPSTQSLLDWMTTTSASNYQLGSRAYTQTTVAGESAYEYTWSGLYEGKTTVLLHNDAVIAISVTWMTPQDEILDEYEQVLRSFEFGALTALVH